MYMKDGKLSNVINVDGRKWQLHYPRHKPVNIACRSSGRKVVWEFWLVLALPLFHFLIGKDNALYTI